MRQTRRWFGPKELFSINDMLQAGVERVISALHHLPTGAVWTAQEIAARQRVIGRMKHDAPSRLGSEVVESLPMPEAIKKQRGVE
ncbi:MAG: mannonate dehydratase, partial [Paracoccaceae bacterium]